MKSDCSQPKLTVFRRSFSTSTRFLAMLSRSSETVCSPLSHPTREGQSPFEHNYVSASPTLQSLCWIGRMSSR